MAGARKAGAPAPGRSAWLASNPSKRWAEVFYLAYSPFWITWALCVLVPFKLYDLLDEWGYLLVGLAAAVPCVAVPPLLPNKADAGRPWGARFWVKLNVWVGVFGFVGNYFWTHYFFNLLGAAYTLPSHRLNGVPLVMYLMTHAYFLFYHALANTALRRVDAHLAHAPLATRRLARGLAVFLLAYGTAYMETLTISHFPYYTHADKAAMYSVGSLFYAIYFFVSFPMVLRLDETPRGRRWGLGELTSLPSSSFRDRSAALCPPPCSRAAPPALLAAAMAPDRGPGRVLPRRGAPTLPPDSQAAQRGASSGAASAAASAALAPSAAGGDGAWRCAGFVQAGPPPRLAVTALGTAAARRGLAAHAPVLLPRARLATCALASGGAGPGAPCPQQPPVRVLCSPAAANRFVEPHEANNAPGSAYAVRKPATTVLAMPFADWAAAWRTWEHSRLLLHVHVCEWELPASGAGARLWPNTTVWPQLGALLRGPPAPGGGAAGGAGATGAASAAPALLDWAVLRQLLAYGGYAPQGSLHLLAGGRDALLPARYATRDRLLAQVAGGARVLLLPPEAGWRGGYAFPVAHPYDGYSAVDWEEPALEHWPAAAGVRGLVCELHPGDSLLVPGGWFVHAQLCGAACVALELGLMPAPGKRLGRGTLLMRLGRMAEARLGAEVGAANVRRWLLALAEGREWQLLAGQLVSVRGSKLVATCHAIMHHAQQVLSLPAAPLPAGAAVAPADTADAGCGHAVRCGAPECAARRLLAAMCDRRLVPTPWLDEGITDALYLRHPPAYFRLEDDAEAAAYAPIFRHCLAQEQPDWAGRATRLVAARDGRLVPALPERGGDGGASRRRDQTWPRWRGLLGDAWLATLLPMGGCGTARAGGGGRDAESSSGGPQPSALELHRRVVHLAGLREEALARLGALDGVKVDLTESKVAQAARLAAALDARLAAAHAALDPHRAAAHAHVRALEGAARFYGDLLRGVTAAPAPDAWAEACRVFAALEAAHAAQAAEASPAELRARLGAALQVSPASQVEAVERLRCEAERLAQELHEARAAAAAAGQAAASERAARLLAEQQRAGMKQELASLRQLAEAVGQQLGAAQPPSGGAAAQQLGQPAPADAAGAAAPPSPALPACGASDGARAFLSECQALREQLQQVYAAAGAAAAAADGHGQRQLQGAPPATRRWDPLQQLRSAMLGPGSAPGSAPGSPAARAPAEPAADAWSAAAAGGSHAAQLRQAYQSTLAQVQARYRQERHAAELAHQEALQAQAQSHAAALERLSQQQQEACGKLLAATAAECELRSRLARLQQEHDALQAAHSAAQQQVAKLQGEAAAAAASATALAQVSHEQALLAAKAEHAAAAAAAQQELEALRRQLQQQAAAVDAAAARTDSTQAALAQREAQHLSLLGELEELRQLHAEPSGGSVGGAAAPAGEQQQLGGAPVVPERGEGGAGQQDPGRSEPPPMASLIAAVLGEGPRAQALQAAYRQRMLERAGQQQQEERCSQHNSPQRSGQAAPPPRQAADQLAELDHVLGLAARRCSGSAPAPGALAASRQPRALSPRTPASSSPRVGGGAAGQPSLKQAQPSLKQPQPSLKQQQQQQQQRACLRCGGSGGASPGRCVFHPGLVAAPGPLLYSPEWHACRAGCSPGAPGCYTRREHTYAPPPPPPASSAAGRAASPSPRGNRAPSPHARTGGGSPGRWDALEAAAVAAAAMVVSEAQPQPRSVLPRPTTPRRGHGSTSSSRSLRIAARSPERARSPVALQQRPPRLARAAAAAQTLCEAVLRHGTTTCCRFRSTETESREHRTAAAAAAAAPARAAMSGQPAALEGVLTYRRAVSKRLVFYDLLCAGGEWVELVVKQGACAGDVRDLRDALKLGDAVCATGEWEEGGGARSLLAATVRVLAPWRESSPHAAFQPRPSPHHRRPPREPEGEQPCGGAPEGPQLPAAPAAAPALAVCKFFLNAGACAKGAACPFAHAVAAGGRRRWVAQRRSERAVLSSAQGFAHAASAADKRRRAQVFARWLVEQYGADALNAGAGVLDVAGGAGGVSFELAVTHGVRVTLVDPRPFKLNKAQHRRLAAAGATAVLERWTAEQLQAGQLQPEVLPLHQQQAQQGQSDQQEQQQQQQERAWLGEGESTDEEQQEEQQQQQQQPPLQAPRPVTLRQVQGWFGPELWRSAGWRALLGGAPALLVGLHPDEATEPILDCALQCGLAFALVPCCVFPRRHPERRTAQGGPVTSYAELLGWLAAKGGASRGVLGFEGANTVVFGRARAASADGAGADGAGADGAPS
ncbi:CPI1 [Scenedesmus sp. PABB004]|nr:CPI1 [Scenedesmus sp. PABB004]